MIRAVVSSNEIKNRAIVDSGLEMQNFPQRNFNRWIVEAVYHIGGTDNSPIFQTDEVFDVVSCVVDVNENVVGVRDVLYSAAPDLASVPKELSGWTRAVRIDGNLLDTSLEEVQYIYTQSTKAYGMSLKINRMKGFARVLGSTLGQPDSMDGHIMVPDSPVWQEAIYWYLMMKLDYLAFRKNPARKGTLYQHSQAMFSQFSKAAYAESLFPDEDGMDRLADTLSLGVTYTGLRRKDPELPGPAKPVDYRL